MQVGMQWYYARDGLRVGPVSAEEFVRLIGVGEVRAGTLVWRAGLASWLPCREVAATNGLPTPIEGDAPPPLPTESAAPFPSRPPIDVPAAPMPRYGGFWARAGAKIVDNIIMFAMGLVVGALVDRFGYHGKPPEMDDLDAFLRYMQLSLACNLAVVLAFQVYFIRRHDATPGKILFGLRLVRSDGSSLSVGRIVGRFFGEQLSQLTLCIGYLTAAVDEEHRTLHDYLCDTRVVKSR